MMAGRLLYDFYTFLTILLYWPLVLLVMFPARFVDRLLGTRALPWLVRITKRIANL
jgi:hypothetical protein